MIWVACGPALTHDGFTGFHDRGSLKRRRLSSLRPSNRVFSLFARLQPHAVRCALCRVLHAYSATHTKRLDRALV